MNQSEIWLVAVPGHKARPMLVLTRSEAIPYVNKVLVAPITSTIRPIASCLPVGTEEGLRHDSVASFDNVTSIPKMFLTTRLGQLGAHRRHEICEAMSAALDC